MESRRSVRKQQVLFVLLGVLGIKTSPTLPDNESRMADYDLTFSNSGVGWDSRTLEALSFKPTPWSNRVVWVDAISFVSVCALDASRTLRCWMLTQDPSNPQARPILSQSRLGFEISQLRAAILNANFSCVLREDGEVWCWSPDRVANLEAPSHENFCRPDPRWLMNAESIFATDYGICARQGRQVQCVVCSGTTAASKHVLRSATAPVIAGIPHALCQRLEDGRLECDGCVLNIQTLSTGDPPAIENLWWSAWEADENTTPSKPTPRHFFVEPPTDWTDFRWGVGPESLRALGLRSLPGLIARIRPNDPDQTTPNYQRLRWCGLRSTTARYTPILAPLTEILEPSFPLGACSPIGQPEGTAHCENRP